MAVDYETRTVLSALLTIAMHDAERSIVSNLQALYGIDWERTVLDKKHSAHLADGLCTVYEAVQMTCEASRV